MTQTLTLTPSADPLDLDPFVGGSPLVITGTVPTTPVISEWFMELWKYHHSPRVADADPVANASGDVTAGVLTVAFAAVTLDMELLDEVGANNYWLIISGTDANGLRQIFRQGTIEITPGYVSTSAHAVDLPVSVSDDIATFVYDGTTYTRRVVAIATPDGASEGWFAVVDDTFVFVVDGVAYSTEVTPA